MTSNHSYTQSKLWHLEFLSDESRLKWVQIAILIFVGLFAFFHNLGLSLLEGTEGLYAHVTHELVRSEQFLHLTYLGQHYYNKPPAFFWLLAGSTTLFGEHEVALRLPGALFSLGTMVITYFLGKMLFSRTAGFWAAFVVATVYVSLWYGRRVLTDSTLTFCMTLAVFAWLRAYLQIGSSRWYVVSFLAMALGTMVKSVHAFAMPFLLLVAFSLLLRDLRPFKSMWFWAGLAVFIGAHELYASILEGEYQWLFSIRAGFIRMFGEAGQGYRPDHPFYWYFTIMWFVFFPWCALIPSSLVLLAQQRPFRSYPREWFVVLWVLGYLLMFSIVQMKREPYLMPILPGLGLMVGYYYETAFTTSDPQRMATPLLKLTLTLLAVAFAVAFYIGPSLLHRNWFVPLSLFPTPFMIVMLSICGFLLYYVMRSRTREALLTLGVLVIGFTFAVVQIILPAIDRAASPRMAAESIKLIAEDTQAPIHLYRPARLSNEDIVYYLTVEPALPVITTERSLVDAAQRKDSVLIVTDRDRFATLIQKPELLVEQVREFQQPRNKNYFLLSIKEKPQAQAGSKG